MFDFCSVVEKVKDWFGGKRIFAPEYKIEFPIDDFSPKLSYPPAAQSRKMITQGKYRYGFPEGAVIHYNAGRDDPKQFLDYMRSMKYVTFLIDRQGHIWQDFPLDEWGHHAGKSEWTYYRKTVHDCFVGIELLSAGVLKPTACGSFKTWFDTTVPENEVRLRGGRYFQKFTFEQEKQLEKLLLWLELTGEGVFSFNNVVGHHEVSPGRKQDPGGSLRFEMPNYREHLKELKKRKKEGLDVC
jgi:N-acetyl-anhydromuramyl-L-alanine amidase AmpD